MSHSKEDHLLDAVVAGNASRVSTFAAGFKAGMARAIAEATAIISGKPQQSGKGGDG